MTPEEYNSQEGTPGAWIVEEGFSQFLKDGTKLKTWNVMAPHGWMEPDGTFFKCSVACGLEDEADARLIARAVNAHRGL